jgi:ABC-type transport system substrate-binding protein
MALYAWSNLPDPDSYTLWGEDQIPLAPRLRGPDYTGGQNHPRWRNAEATELLRRAARILDRDERRALYHQFQEILAVESPAIPLVAVTQLDAYPADIRGFVPHPARQTNSWNCWEWY